MIIISSDAAKSKSGKDKTHFGSDGVALSSGTGGLSQIGMSAAAIDVEDAVLKHTIAL